MHWLMVAAPLLAAGIGMAAGGRTAGAAGATVSDADQAALRERCATRISIALVGKSASDDLLASSNPQSGVDALLASPDFFERFARFVNSQFNRDPGKAPAEDASYYLAKYVLENGKPWTDLFLGPYNVDADDKGNVQVTDDPNGLGYFRSQPWLFRYAGNELAGIKISTAYRIMNNMVGLQLMATTNAPDADVSVTGRHAGTCAGCHFQNWYALDQVAGILSKKTKDDKGNVTFTPYTGGSQKILGGKMIADDQGLVQALAGSENFSFNACRLSFSYLYGRAENKCEGPVLDRCIDAFKSQKTIQSALSVIAKDPGFCQ